MKIFFLFLCLALLIILVLLIINCFKDKFNNSKLITVSQKGSDGFGHQLHGVISLIGCHDLIYNIDFNELINNFNHSHKYQHLNKKDMILCNKFMFKFIARIIKLNNFTIKDNNKNCIYKDNAFGNKKCMNNFYKYYNYDNFKDLYVHSNYINKKKYNKIIALHARFGDSGKRSSNYNILNKLIINLNNIYINSFFIIHTDGNINKFIYKSNNIIYKNKNTNILQCFFDLINSDILIYSYSSLSTSAILLGNHELIIEGPSISSNQHILKPKIKKENYNNYI